MVAKQYPRDSAIISAPSRYLRRDTPVDLCCNSSPTTLAREYRDRTESVFVDRARTTTIVFPSLYPAQARFIVTLLAAAAAAAAGRIYVLLSFAFRRRSGRGICERGFLCDITKRGISARYSIPFFISLCFSLRSCICRIESRLCRNCSYLLCPSFFHSNASKEINLFNFYWIRPCSIPARFFYFEFGILEFDLRTFH